MTCSKETSAFGCERTAESTVQTAVMRRAGCTEFFLTAMPEPGEDFFALFQKFASAVRDLDAEMVSLDIFGVPAGHETELAEAFGSVMFPVTWVIDGCTHPGPLFGMQGSAVRGPAVIPVEAGGNVVGTTFDADGVQYLRLGGLLPSGLSASRDEQAHSVFELMVEALESVGMGFSDVVRTWFYNHDLLEWYDVFNDVRTSFFCENGVFDGVVPASTGIGAGNTAGAVLTAGLLAVKARPGAKLKPMAVASPLQCPALDYGSSFSRATEFEAGGFRRLYVSGTASIEPGGRSVHIDDTRAQVMLTMDVVEAILDARNMKWSDVTRAIAYFRNDAEAPLLEECCAERGIASMPVLYANTDICRDDLLFELELDAATEAGL